MLLPAYHKCYPKLLAQGKVSVYYPPATRNLPAKCLLQDSVCALLGMLSSTITELKKEDVRNHSALLSQVFISMLEYRTAQKDMEVTLTHPDQSFIWREGAFAHLGS